MNHQGSAGGTNRWIIWIGVTACVLPALAAVLVFQRSAAAVQEPPSPVEDVLSVEGPGGHRHAGSNSHGDLIGVVRPIPPAGQVESRAKIEEYAASNPYAYRRFLATAKRRGWAGPGVVSVSGHRKPLEEILRDRRRPVDPDHGRVKPAAAMAPGRNGVIPAQYYQGGGSGQMWVWEWNCGEDRFCGNIVLYSNQYGEELNFAIEWIPTSEDDGYVAFSEGYTYDPGVRFGEENREFVRISATTQTSAAQGVIRARAQGGYGMIIRARALCLLGSLNYNWRSGIRWNLGWNFVGCLPFGVRWSTGGYLGCLAWGTGIDQVAGFVHHVINEAGNC